MIALIEKSKLRATSFDRQNTFVRMLPEIRKQAQFAFRGLRAEAREEVVQEVVAAAYQMFRSLALRGKTGLAYPTPLTQFAIGKVRDGRRIGSRRNRRDITSPCARTTNGITIERLDRFDRRRGEWREILIEDRRSNPAEIAAIRLDFAGWLDTLSTRDRKLVQTLVLGETTGRVARMFQISAARVSQLRRELCENWHRFVDELADTSGPSVATARCRPFLAAD